MAVGYSINSENICNNAIHHSIHIEVTRQSDDSARDDKSADRSGDTNLGLNIVCLEFSFGCGISPGLDLGQRVDVVDELLDGGVLGVKVGHLQHHLQVVVQTRDVEVSPGQLASGDVSAVLLDDGVELGQHERVHVLLQHRLLLGLHLSVVLVVSGGGPGADVINEVDVLVDLEVLVDISAGEPVLAAEVAAEGQALRVLLAVNLQGWELAEGCLWLQLRPFGLEGYAFVFELLAAVRQQEAHALAEGLAGEVGENVLRHSEIVLCRRGRVFNGSIARLLATERSMLLGYIFPFADRHKYLSIQLHNKLAQYYENVPKSTRYADNFARVIGLTIIFIFILITRAISNDK
ncbi:unnamed protein product [Chrysodeixis includens]|uniref:Uncharacterized protein n=1 Tax=Chrysodeixis includens TaxID=689277 RepID=A0A9N8KY94_CHRIL|nr:unnamed protein product [Chrysodeixis includens]